MRFRASRPAQEMRRGLPRETLAVRRKPSCRSCTIQLLAEQHFAAEKSGGADEPARDGDDAQIDYACAPRSSFAGQQTPGRESDDESKGRPDEKMMTQH